MKKSSLLSLSLVSLVALVGCGKKGSASPKDLDKKVTALVNKYFIDGTITDPLTAVLTVTQELEIRGYYAVMNDMEPGKYTDKASFHIAYNQASYEWEVDPQEGEEWTEEELDAAAELIEDAQLQYIASAIFYLPIYNSAYEMDEEGERVVSTSYFQEFKEEIEEYDGYFCSFGTDPLSWGYGYTYEGEVEDPGLSYQGKQSVSYTYNSKGFLTKFVDSSSESTKGFEDRELDGKFVEKSTYSIKYLSYDEAEA